MPGFFITNTSKCPELVNYDDSRCIKGEFKCREWTVKWNVLDKFIDDKVFINNNLYLVVIDGVVLNKRNLIHKYGQIDWNDTIIFMIRRNCKFFEEFRGCFSGAVYIKEEDRWIIFADQIGNRLVLSYSKGNCIAFGSQLNYFSDWMKLNNIEREINDDWKNDFFSFGYMLDVHTIIQNVNRLFPGDYIECLENRIEEKEYYRIKKSEKHIATEEAVEGIEKYFMQAVHRILDKCGEYGYRAIVDVSGGLDSRSIALTAVQDGYDKITGINYSQLGSPDQIISLMVAKELKLNLLQYSMDGGDCIKDIDSFIFMNNGMNFYAGITGAKSVLESLDRREFGIELRGVLGDVYDGAMVSERNLNELKWDLDRFRTVRRFPVYNTKGYNREYADNEMLWYYVRGMLAGENTAFIRQNFIEAPLPYGDVEFMDFYFSIPYEKRAFEHILRKWMIKKHPEMARIKHAHTGTRVFVNHYAELLFAVPFKLRNRYTKHVLHKSRSMNPFDDWYTGNADLRNTFEDYFTMNIDKIKQYDEISKMISQLYGEGANALEKIVALSALSAIKQYIL